MSKVAIIRGTNPPDITVTALEMVNAAQALPVGKTILVKPNYVATDAPTTGITTDGRIVEGVVRFLREHAVQEIIIGEGSGEGDTFEAFRVAGVNQVAERWKATMVDLNRDEFVHTVPQ
ncbi:DUF362 domain-containing protein, partial [bacterium]